MKPIMRIQLLFGLFLIGATPARADIIYTNIEDPFFVAGYVVDSTSIIAGSFIPTSNAYVGGVQLAAALYLGGPNNLHVQLMTTNTLTGGPGTTIESYDIINQMVFYPSNTTTVKADSLTHPYLEAGQKYWLAAFPGNPSSSLAWNNSLSGSGGIARSTNGGASWTVLPSSTAVMFQIDAAVPEPSSYVLLGLSTLVLAGFAWRRRQTASAASAT